MGSCGPFPIDPSIVATLLSEWAVEHRYAINNIIDTSTHTLETVSLDEMKDVPFRCSA